MSRALTQPLYDAYKSDYISSMSSCTSDSERWRVAYRFDNMFKKFTGHIPGRDVISDETRATEALNKFLASNSACVLDFKPSKEMQTIFEEARVDLARMFEKAGYDILSYEDIALHMHPGPGASNGSRGRTYAGKLQHCVAATSEFVLDTWYRIAYALNPPAAKALRKVRTKVLSYNTLLTVPKTYQVDRVICKECLANSEMQLAVGTLIEETLYRGTGMNLSDQQSFNRRFALLGSSKKTYATIDLSSASDTISCGFVDYMFAYVPSVLNWMKALRAPSTKLPSGELLPLRMFSSMGNGFTFPLQTLVFSCLMRSLYKHEGIVPQMRYNANLAVNGDDIIVIDSLSEKARAILCESGFSVNFEKSFHHESPFRESCGHDYYDGVFCRPVFVTSLDSYADIKSAYNRLLLSQHDRTSYTSLLRVLYSMLPKDHRNPIPRWESDVGGLKVLYPVDKRSYYLWVPVAEYERTRVEPELAISLLLHNAGGLSVLKTEINPSSDRIPFGVRPEWTTRFRRVRRSAFNWEVDAGPFQAGTRLPLCT